MKFLLLILMFTSEVFALEAVVTVLETPMLREKDLDAKVVQYLRKGDVIKIHPAIGNTKKYDHMAPKDFKAPDFDTSEFTPTLDRQGNIVYVLTEHLYVYFEDLKESSQKVLAKDPTDYRLQEPLPKNYPLSSLSGYRGQALFGFTQPYYQSYPYHETIKAKGYNSPTDFTFTLLRQSPGDHGDRLYLGSTLNVRFFENNYLFSDNRQSDEKGFKVGIGPYVSYDAYKGEKNRLNLYMAVNFYFFNQLYITQSFREVSDTRTYRAYSVSPRIGLQYHRKNIMENLDFVLGTAMESELPTVYEAKNRAYEASWWRSATSDKFTTTTTFSLGGYLGLQAAY